MLLVRGGGRNPSSFICSFPSKMENLPQEEAKDNSGQGEPWRFFLLQKSKFLAGEEEEFLFEVFFLPGVAAPNLGPAPAHDDVD